MTTTAGNGPLPSGVARKPLIISSPERIGTSEVLTWAAAVPASSGRDRSAVQNLRVWRIVGSSLSRDTGIRSHRGYSGRRATPGQGAAQLLPSPPKRGRGEKDTPCLAFPRLRRYDP